MLQPLTLVPPDVAPIESRGWQRSASCSGFDGRYQGASSRSLVDPSSHANFPLRTTASGVEPLRGTLMHACLVARGRGRFSITPAVLPRCTGVPLASSTCADRRGHVLNHYYPLRLPRLARQLARTPPGRRWTPGERSGGVRSRPLLWLMRFRSARVYVCRDRQERQRLALHHTSAHLRQQT